MQLGYKNKFKHNIVLLFFIAFCVDFSLEDLPVHCLKHQILGRWLITASDLISVESGYDMKCGHDLPSKEETSHLAQSPYELKNQYEVNLREIDFAEIFIESNKYIGRWTMVYDEGFNIDFEDLSFFAFSKYMIDKSNPSKIQFNSMCYSTCVGWYHNKDKTKWGCYTARKLDVNPLEITNKDTKNNVSVLEPTLNLENNIINSMLNMQFKSIKSEITFNNADLINDKAINFNGSINSSIRKNNKDNLRKVHEIVKNTSFLELEGKEKSSSTLRLTSSFRNHALYVSKLRHVKKNWNADVNPEFSNMSIKELNKFAGITRNSRGSVPFKKKNFFSEDISQFPKNYDWKKYLRPAGSQGNCGSCYAYSTTRMIEARLKIAYGHEARLSVQHALDCSIYNQGCEGGYPFLVMKFSSEYELIPEMCKPYLERNTKCGENVCDVKLLPLIYRTINYRYIGGSYGQCSEKKIMQEVFEKGPIVVSFEPDYNFMMYKSGIYHSIDEKTWISKGIPKPEWEKVDHSVLLVGWGEDEITKEKFWIIQNTWGPNWGESGFFRMRRGVDEFGIESICEAADPLVVERLTNRIIDKKELLEIEKKENNVINNIQNNNDNFEINSTTTTIPEKNKSFLNEFNGIGNFGIENDVNNENNNNNINIKDNNHDSIFDIFK